MRSIFIFLGTIVALAIFQSLNETTIQSRAINAVTGLGILLCFGAAFIAAIQFVIVPALQKHFEEEDNIMPVEDTSLTIAMKEVFDTLLKADTISKIDYSIARLQSFKHRFRHIEGMEENMDVYIRALERRKFLLSKASPAMLCEM